MASILGLDWGEKRVGLAVAETTTRMALPFETLPFEGRQKFLDRLRPVLEGQRVIRIVVGLPMTLKGEIGPAAQKVNAHAAWLREVVDIPVDMWDERLTTAEVDRVLREGEIRAGRRRELRDQLAAQRILQAYVDSRPAGNLE